MNRWERGKADLISEQDLSEAQRQLGHELAQKYAGMSFPRTVKEIEKSHNLPSDWTAIRVGKIPAYISPSEVTPVVRTGVDGVTFHRGGAYPLPVKYPATIALDPDNIMKRDVPSETLLETLDHELQHVQEVKEKNRRFPITNDRTQEQGYHFATDEPGELFPWEGKRALGLMVDRLQSNPWARKQLRDAGLE